MNRRKAIGSIALAGLAGAGIFSGIEYHRWNKQPDFQFIESHIKTLEALAETIIPTTETVGAKYCGVDKFILRMVTDCTDIRDTNCFVDGLKDLVQYSYDNYRKKFEDCTPLEQVVILRHFEKKGKQMSGIWGKAQYKYLGRSFFLILKEYTVLGYCTSERGALEALAYTAIPGSYRGCVQLLPGQRSWATR